MEMFASFVPCRSKQMNTPAPRFRLLEKPRSFSEAAILRIMTPGHKRAMSSSRGAATDAELSSGEYVTAPTSPLSPPMVYQLSNPSSQTSNHADRSSLSSATLTCSDEMVTTHRLKAAKLIVWPIEQLRPLRAKKRLAVDSEGPNSPDDTFQDYSEGKRAVVQSNAANIATLHRETLNVSPREGRRLTRARKKLASQMRRFWRVAASGRAVENMSTRKRSLQIHDSRRCETYPHKEPRYKRFRVEEVNGRWIPPTTQGPNFLRFKIDGFSPTWLLLLVSELEERWDNSWRPGFSRLFRSAQFWIIQIGTYILVAPVLIPWEVCAIVGILVVRIWNSSRDMSRDRILLKLRDSTEWLADDGMIGIIWGTCMALGGAFVRRHSA